MSMSTHVVGFRLPDAQFTKMKAAYDACKSAGIEPPAKVHAFFNHETPDDNGVEIDLRRCPAVKEYRADMQDGYEVDLTKLPKDLTVIRFYNSY